ncbi:MAG: protoporphyrinogen oxidase [Chloroflexi bacterium]|nr:protoporphyrinogen oxidase [Chloroflexota bacterium]
MHTPQHIAIVGGGIAGLAAAHAIARDTRERGLDVTCTLLEAGDRLGGKVQTERADGFLVEQGPDAMLARKVEGRQFCEALGLGGDLVGSNTQAGSTYVVHRGRLEPLPEGMMLVAPVHLNGWLKTRLLSPAGKLRAGLDLVLPARAGGEDETLADFVSRRFGREVAERLAVPLLAAVYGGGSGDLSLRATFPDLGKLEQTHRSVLLGLRAMAKRRAGPSGAAPGGSPDGKPAPGRGAGPSPFVTLRGGLASMVTRAAQSLDGVQVRCDAPVSALEDIGGPGGSSGRPRYRLAIRGGGGGTIEADAVILAAPSFVTARLVERLAPAAAEALAGIDYLPTTVVVVAFPKERIANPLRGTGFLVPESEQRRIIACTWLSRKWPHVSDPGTMLLRCYVGGPSQGAALAALPDADLIALTCDELRDLLGVEGAPVFTRVYRWPRAIPRYALGHLERVGRAERALAELPGLALAGAAYHGIGVPDCIRQGRLAAAAVLPPLAQAAASPELARSAAVSVR